MHVPHPVMIIETLSIAESESQQRVDLLSSDQILWRVEREGERLEKPPDCPQELYAVMRRCWACYPADRPSFAQLITMVAEV